jgi:uncharacterized RmlC-like cupin family protein
MAVHANIKALQRQIISEMGAKDKAHAIAQLKDAIYRSDGRAQRAYEALLATLQAEPKAGER